MVRSYDIGVAPSAPIQGVFNMTLPPGGPKVIPLYVDMTTATSVEMDLSPFVQNGNIDFVSGAWIDNSASAEDLTVRVDGTKQAPIIPAGSQAYMPLLAPNMPKFTFSAAVAPGVILPVIFYNVPLLPFMWDTASAGGIAIDWTGYPGLTNTQLRASAIQAYWPGVALTNRSIANLSGASETLMAANAGRSTLFIQNIAANNMGINLFNGTAAIGTAGTLTLVPGATLSIDSNCPVGAITIIGTANDDVTAWEA